MIVTLDLTPTEADLLWKLSWYADQNPSALGVKLRAALDAGTPHGLLPRDCPGVHFGVDEAGNVQSVSGTGPEIADVLGIDLGAESRRVDPEEGEAN